MKVEIRNNEVHLEGYVNVVSRDSRVLPSVRGKFIEQIEPRTFARALEKTENVDLLFNHREDRKLGSTSSGELRLHEDSIGLRAICRVSDPEVIEKAKAGELRGWSFGMIVKEDRWVEEGDVSRRYVSDIDLLECSILSVTPAYIATSIESRTGEGIIEEQRFDVNNDVEYIKEEVEKREEKKDEDPVFDYSELENYLLIKK